MNTPRELLLPALNFSLEYRFKRGRPARFFAISKDAKDEDHVGRPCSHHFWEISSDVVIATVQWELEHNALFEVLSEVSNTVVLRQDKGLPIGRHLSAELVELVALYRELLQPFPNMLCETITARYRDNFFVATARTIFFFCQDTSSL